MAGFLSKQQTPLQILIYHLLENAFTDFGAFVVFFLFFFFLGFTLLFVKSAPLWRLEFNTSLPEIENT